ncbi:A/G-specific adenine glycosylase [Parapedobacter sp. DT-150]|uniref:A/G-specific adenine glycosylase n=1 Tax=Parapedobacter sp. DT-150 TaxID=3396162 RepID=UPI003F1C18FF
MAFSSDVISWYHLHKRDLPWRHIKDPYIIWLSEIILQQTRVEQGLPYFHRFLSYYPDVISFASAPEDEILLHWQGLGYYSRARNMHKAAKTVVAEYGGVFPATYQELIKLSGVGEYTAAAIASFAADEAKAVVDGNVFRVLARYFGIDQPINSPNGKKLFQALAQELLDVACPGIYNQAIMEFGALQCKPNNPDCAACVLRMDCRALKEGRVSHLPVKTKGKASRNRYFNYFLVMDGDRLLMNKRGRGDIWENLYELPLIETAHQMEVRELATAADVMDCFGPHAELRLVTGPVKHVLSHQNLYAQFIAVTACAEPRKKMNWDYVFIKDLGTLAKPKLIYSFFEDFIVE